MAAFRSPKRTKKWRRLNFIQSLNENPNSTVEKNYTRLPAHDCENDIKKHQKFNENVDQEM